MDGDRKSKAAGPLMNEGLGATHPLRCIERTAHTCGFCEEVVILSEGFYQAGPSFSTLFVCDGCFESFPHCLELRNRFDGTSYVACDMCGRSATAENPEFHVLNDFDVCSRCFHMDSIKAKFQKIRAPTEFIRVDNDLIIRAFPEVPVGSLPPWVTIPMYMSTRWLEKQYARINSLPSSQWNAMACVVVKSSCEVLQRYTDAGLICLVACLSIPGHPVALMHELRPISLGCWLIGPQLFDTIGDYQAHFRAWVRTQSVDEWVALDAEADTKTAVENEANDSISDYNKIDAKAEPDYVTHLYLSVQGRIPDGLRK